MSYIPNTPEDQEMMLARLDLPSLEALLAPVPENVRLPRPLDLPPALSEPDLKRALYAMAAKNKNLDTTISFLGAGTYDHAIPSVVPHLQLRSEFVTSYTPYQPEVSQGMLQAIYEFQTMVCQITGLISPMPRSMMARPLSLISSGVSFNASLTFTISPLIGEISSEVALTDSMSPNFTPCETLWEASHDSSM